MKYRAMINNKYQHYRQHLRRDSCNNPIAVRCRIDAQWRWNNCVLNRLHWLYNNILESVKGSFKAEDWVGEYSEQCVINSAIRSGPKIFTWNYGTGGFYKQLVSCDENDKQVLSHFQEFAMIFCITKYGYKKAPRRAVGSPSVGHPRLT